MIADLHPSCEDLNAFCQGSLDDDLYPEVEAHLSSCVECLQRAMDAPEDGLVELLRASHMLGLSHAETPALGSRGTITCVWGSLSDGLENPLPHALIEHPRYCLLRPLGRGGMGTVWLAEHKLMDRKVALKLIRPEFLSKPGAIERFQREVQAAAKLHHPNIVEAHDAERAGQSHFLVMEYIEGESLSDRVARDGPLPINEACRVIRDAALGLQHAHAHGLIHRDLKPHNLMCRSDGVVKVLDFGLAASVEAGPSGLTSGSMVVGTPDYIAPEQAENARSADARSDIYSLGCTLYTLLSGRVPFPVDSTLRKLDDHRHREAEPITTFRPEVPLELARVVSRMMAKDPDSRYQTAFDVAEALTDLINGPMEEVSPRRKFSSRGFLSPKTWIVMSMFIPMLLFAGVVYRIQTDRGELVIHVESDEVEVVVKQGGELVKIIDTKSERTVTLRSGEYDLELKGKPEGLKLDLEKATLSCGKTVLVRIERIKQGQKTVELPKPGLIREFKGHQGWGLRCVVFSPDGNSVLSSDAAGLVILWDTASGKEIRRLIGHRGEVPSVDIAADGHLAATCGVDNTARVWNLETGVEQARFEGAFGTIEGVSISPDGNSVLTSSGDGIIRLWNVRTGKLIRRLEGHRNAIRSVVFSGDGKWALSGSRDRTVRLWDVDTGKEIRRFEGHMDSVAGVAFSRDNRLAASGSLDRTARVWDIETGKEISRFHGHEGRGLPVQMAFTPDNRFVLSGGTDSAIRLWDIATATEQHRFDGHTGSVYWVSISPNGCYALSGGSDLIVRLWRLPNLARKAQSR